MSNSPRCGECGGSLEDRKITHLQPWGKELVRFEKVPAKVCVQCGHVWLSADVSQSIDKAIRQHSKPTKFLKVPVYSFAELSHS